MIVFGAQEIVNLLLGSDGKSYPESSSLLKAT